MRGITFIQRQDVVNKQNIGATLLSTLLVFLIVSFTTKENVCVVFEASKSCIFAYVMAALWCGICSTITNFCYESHHLMPQFKKGFLSVRNYVLGTFFVHTCVAVLQAILGTIILSVFVELPGEGVIFKTLELDVFFTTFLIIEAACSLGIFLGIFIDNIKFAMSILPIVLIAQMLFSKTIFDITGNFTEKISNFIISKYGVAALGSLLDINRYPLALRLVYPMIEQTNNELFNPTTSYIFDCWNNLVVLTIIPLIASYFFLICKKNKKH